MTKRKTNPPAKKLKGAHEGSADLVSVIEKVAPFLFSKKKKEQKMEELARKEEKKWKAVTKKAKKIEATVRTGKPLKKTTKAPSAKPSKLPAATLEVKKEVKKAKNASEIFSGGASKDVTPQDEVSQDAALEDKKPKGALLLQEEEDTTEHDKEQASALAADAQNDAFLSKVAQPKLTAAKIGEKKPAGWSIFKNRFFGKVKDEPKAKKEEELTAEEVAQDSFLQRVQKKKVDSVVGTALDPDDPNSSKIAGKDVEMLDDMLGLTSGKKEAKAKEEPKGRILSASDLRKETKEAKEAAVRLEKEVKEIKEEMRSTQKEREKDIEKIDKEIAAKKKEPESNVPAELRVNKKMKYKKKGGFQQFLAAFGHIGLGKERNRFVENLATMLNAGLPLIDSLQTLKLETRTKPMKKLLQQILDSVENGSPLWRAMEEQSFFSLHALALIRIGEEAGNLAENMEYLAKQETKDNELRSKVKMAMIYPSIVMVIMFIIVIGLGWFVLPNLIGVLYSLNVELPFVTRMVIAFTNAFTEHGVIGVPAFMAGCVVFMILAKYTALRGAVQWVMFRIPGIGALARQATIARFGVILGGLLKAGVPVVEAMQSLVDVTPIVAYRKLYSRMLDHITVGDSFSKSFAAIKKSEKLLPPSVQQLVITGEKSGALADIMLKVADIYDRKASETAQKLPVILEPMLLLFIGGLVGTIAFAIIVPIYSIVGTVGRG